MEDPRHTKGETDVETMKRAQETRHDGPSFQRAYLRQPLSTIHDCFVLPEVLERERLVAERFV